MLADLLVLLLDAIQTKQKIIEKYKTRYITHTTLLYSGLTQISKSRCLVPFFK